MARFIDADKLVEHIKDLPTWRELLGVGWRSTKYPNGMFDCEDIINSIKNQPTADVVEVVRCKDCKHGDVSVIEKTKCGQETVACYCNIHKLLHSLDWYCPNGERKKTNEKFGICT